MTRAHRHPAARLYFWISDRFYNELAWAFDAVTWLLSGGRWAQWREAALPYLRGGRIVELGAGTGALLHTLAQRGQPAYGLDRSGAMVKLAARRMRRGGWPVRGLQAAAQALPFPTGAVDTLVSIFPAGFLLEASGLREAARVLRAGPTPGRLVVVGLCLQSPERLMRWAMRLLYGRPPEGVLADFARQCEAAGLHVVEVAPGRREMPVPIVVVAPAASDRAGEDAAGKPPTGDEEDEAHHQDDDKIRRRKGHPGEPGL